MGKVIQFPTAKARLRALMKEAYEHKGYILSLSPHQRDAEWGEIYIQLCQYIKELETMYYAYEKYQKEEEE